jgi:hypothetical protein
VVCWRSEYMRTSQLHGAVAHAGNDQIIGELEGASGQCCGLHILFLTIMPQGSTQQFERLPLRVHTFLAGVPLHDVWAVDLPRWRAGVTLDDFLRTASNRLFAPSCLVRMLLDIRLFLGRFFGRATRTGSKAA